MIVNTLKNDKYRTSYVKRISERAWNKFKRIEFQMELDKMFQSNEEVENMCLMSDLDNYLKEEMSL